MGPTEEIEQPPLLDADARRKKWEGRLGAKRLVRSDFIIEDRDGVRSSMKGIAYLQRANLQVQTVVRDKLAARVAGFPNLVFVHVTMPETTVLWPRDEFSSETMTLIIRMRGNLEIESDGGILSWDPGISLVRPGTTPIRFTTSGPRTEVLYVSMDAARFADLVPDMDERPPGRRVTPGTLTPLLAFIANTCTIVDPRPEIAEALEPVALEVVRSLLVSAFGRRTPVEPLFSRVHRYILDHFHEAELRIEHVARHLNVAVRTIQVELQNGGTTFVKLLQHARTVAALELLRSEPSVTRADLARRCGFGSLSSLQGALRSVSVTDASG